MKDVHFMTRDDIRDLLALRSDAGVLSIYLDGGRQAAPRKPGWQMSHVRSGLKELAQKHSGAKQLEQTADEALQEIAGLPGEFRQRSLVYFRDAGGEQSWWRSLQRPLATRFVWMDTPFIRPLVAYLDDSPEVGVILLSKDEARLITWRQGILLKDSEERIQPSEDARRDEGPLPSHPPRSPHAMSPADRLRDRASQKTRRFAVELADAVPRTAVRRGWERLVIMAPSPLREEFQAQLKEPWRSSIIGSTDKVMLRASSAELSADVDEIITRWNRERESQDVEQTYNLAQAGGRAVTGPQESLKLLQQARVAHLFFAADLVLRGRRMEDGTLQLDDGAKGSAGAEESHLVERMVEMALETGASVTPVEGTPAERIKEMGGIAARLRY
ncbi:MAG: hypothetical protein GF355_06160 [Candidatus Eisenbacteria bacterium]|nr:hypothetical protein [Candidatus Eisenbacteria bacterium]